MSQEEAYGTDEAEGGGYKEKARIKNDKGEGAIGTEETRKGTKKAEAGGDEEAKYFEERGGCQKELEQFFDRHNKVTRQITMDKEEGRSSKVVMVDETME